MKFFIVFTIYVVLSCYLFPRVYRASNQVIDELFHLRQGILYCKGDFHVWDPKITTFPGLYLASALLNYPLRICTIWTLRLTSLFASILNLWLIYHIRLHVLRSSGAKLRSLANVELESLTIALLPPMYFFAHLYYTDVLSITTVLAMMLLNLRNQHSMASVFGFMAVMSRQTNVVWVAMSLGTTVIDKLVSQTLPFIRQTERTDRYQLYSFVDIRDVLQFYTKRVYLIPKQLRLLVSHLFGYIVVLVGFVAFVVWNGGVVVGDKEAHTASLHIPQLFYFVLFTGLFGCTIWAGQAFDVLKQMHRHLKRFAIAAFAMAVTICFNTIEHPYLLADNRHFTFYAWKLFSSQPHYRYAIIPKCLGMMQAINNSLCSMRSAGFRFCLVICVLAALCLQQLIEVRYFLIPYLYVRLHSAPSHRVWILAELLVAAFFNAFAFHIFQTKEIYWDDFEKVQRLMW